MKQDLMFGCRWIKVWTPHCTVIGKLQCIEATGKESLAVCAEGSLKCGQQQLQRQARTAEAAAAEESAEAVASQDQQTQGHLLRKHELGRVPYVRDLQATIDQNTGATAEACLPIIPVAGRLPTIPCHNPSVSELETPILLSAAKLWPSLSSTKCQQKYRQLRQHRHDAK